MVWDPSRIAHVTWPRALAFCLHLEERNEDYRPLRQLVEHVIGSSYAGSLACATSGTSLLVVPTSRLAGSEEPDWARSAVRIDVDLGGTARLMPQDPRAARAATFANDGPGLAKAFERFLESEKWLGAGSP
jgi:hypothetical protein